MTCDNCMPRQTMGVSNEREEEQFPNMLVFDATCPKCGETIKCITLHPRLRLTEEEQKTVRGADPLRHLFAHEVET